MKKTSNILLILSFSYSACILALGSWWLYLIVKYGEQVAKITGDGQGNKVLKMVKWEGGTFLTLLILLSASLLFLYLKDQKKTKGLQAFFASMTHELKTPLASIKLQAEVISETLENNYDEKIETLTKRILQDTQKMETQMDKILQLSRLEGGGTFPLVKINLKEIWETSLLQWGGKLTIEGDIPKTVFVLADELALGLIFRNLFENTVIHTNSTKCKIEVLVKPNHISFIYTDEGKFNGEISKLGTLFYKHSKKKGSGIGLYLMKKLMKTMKGELAIATRPSMTFKFNFMRENISV